MSDICIISEFNPMHNGHAYLIEKGRELGAKRISLVMSGNATQRGELAICDKYARAEAAIKGGADLVLELPFPWCASSADYFALAGVYIASRVSDTLLFGSECGDIELLERAAELCESESFGRAFEDKKRSMGAAKAFSEALSDAGFGVLGSNDLLGLAYIRAIKRMKLPLTCVTVKREGAGYNQTQFKDGEMPSATAIRELVMRGELDKVRRAVPPSSASMLCDAVESGELTDMRLVDGAVLNFFRLHGAEELSDVAEAGGGLAGRICTAARESASARGMFEKTRTKRYTDARIRRAILFSMTGVKSGTLDSLPEYTCLLGANARGRELLSKARREEGIRIITKPADAPAEAEQYLCSQKLDLFFGIAREKKQTLADSIRKNAYIEIGEKT